MATSAPKRSLFNKPSWATTDISTQEKDSPTIFGRNEVYSDILAQQRKRREEQAAKTKDRATERESKRRRISTEDEEPSDDSDARSDKSEIGENSQKENVERGGPVTRSTPLEKHGLLDDLDSRSPLKSSTDLKTGQEQVNLIEIGDDDDNRGVCSARPPSKGSPKRQPPKSLEEDPESEDDDEYLQELKRKAREKARLRKLGIDVKRSPDAGTGLNPARSSSLQGEQKHSLSAFSTVNIPQAHPSMPELSSKEEDPQVQILITSFIPNTKQLIVHRRASQPLQVVKDVWCARQNFSEIQAAKVFLTWRGTKLFNTSTMMSILKLLKRERPTGLNGDEDPSQGRIEVEAMTEEFFQHRQRQKARAQAEATGLSTEPADQDEEAEAGPAAPQEPKHLIKLQAQGMEAMQLKVRPSTKISDIMRGFKRTMKVEENKTCWLVFDGERLEPDLMIADTDIEDQDVIEVLLR